MSSPTTAAAVPPGLEALLVKEGVAIGGLPEAQRHLALGFVWAGLPAATRALGAALASLDTAAVAAECRAAHEARRAERRRAFESRPAPGRAAGAGGHG
jgi:hypothetical protein